MEYLPPVPMPGWMLYESSVKSERESRKWQGVFTPILLLLSVLLGTKSELAGSLQERTRPKVMLHSVITCRSLITLLFLISHPFEFLHTDPNLLLREETRWSCQPCHPPAHRISSQRNLQSHKTDPAIQPLQPHHGTSTHSIPDLLVGIGNGSHFASNTSIIN